MDRSLGFSSSNLTASLRPLPSLAGTPRVFLLSSSRSSTNSNRINYPVRRVRIEYRRSERRPSVIEHEGEECARCDVSMEIEKVLHDGDVGESGGDILFSCNKKVKVERFQFSWRKETRIEGSRYNCFCCACNKKKKKKGKYWH